LMPPGDGSRDQVALLNQFFAGGSGDKFSIHQSSIDPFRLLCAFNSPLLVGTPSDLGIQYAIANSCMDVIFVELLQLCFSALILKGQGHKIMPA